MRQNIDYDKVCSVEIVGDKEDPDTYREPTIAINERCRTCPMPHSASWIQFSDCDDLLGFIEELQRCLSVCLARRNREPEHVATTDAF